MAASVADGGPGLVLSAPALVSHRSPIDAAHVRSLVDAAADAGFAGMSIWTAHYDWAVAGGSGPEAFFEWHRERDLAIPAAEVIFEWGGADRRAVAESCGQVLDVAARAGASSVIAVTLDAEAPPAAEAAAGLAALCDLAAERGLAVSFEFLPWTWVATIADAVRLIDAVDRDNLGLVLDAWHWFRQPGGPDVATLRTVPPDRIHLLQLNDAPERPSGDLITETMARLLPGEGDVDLLGLLDVLAEIGASPVIVSEVFSAELAELGTAENARRQHAAATALLSRHREAAAERARSSGT